MVLERQRLEPIAFFTLMPIGDNSFITTTDGKSLFVKESKSRILKMIETAK